MKEADRALARIITKGDAQPTGQVLVLRRGVVSAVGSGYATITIAESEPVDVPVYRDVTVQVADVVDVLLAGPAPRIIGVVGAPLTPAEIGPQGLIGYIRIDDTHTSGEGKYDGSQTALAASFTVATTQITTGLYCQNIPVLPNRVIRVRFHFAAAGPPNVNQEAYFYATTQYNGSGGYSINQEVRYEPSGGNAPSPEGEMFFYTPSNATTLNVRIEVKMSNLTLTIYRFIAGQPSVRSYMTVEDLGPVA